MAAAQLKEGNTLAHNPGKSVHASPAEILAAPRVGIRGIRDGQAGVLVSLLSGVRLPDEGRPQAPRWIDTHSQEVFSFD